MLGLHNIRAVRYLYNGGGDHTGKDKDEAEKDEDNPEVKGGENGARLHRGKDLHIAGLYTDHSRSSSKYSNAEEKF